MKLNTDKNASEIRGLYWLGAFGFISLIAVTWSLWTPQSSFPQIPLVWLAGQLPNSSEIALLVALLAALASLLVPVPRACSRFATVVVGICTFGLVCIDQHRLQPWVWQFLMLSLVLASADAMTARDAWRWLVIGIYAWSAWSKIDYGFCVQHGPFLLDGICKSIGLAKRTQVWPEFVRFGVAGAIPVFELSIAVGLSWTRTRRIALIGAGLMHVGLLLALGPLGHNHLPGVLVWNIFFLVQNWMLFGRYWNATGIKTMDGAGPITGPCEVATESTDVSLGRPGITSVADSFDQFGAEHDSLVRPDVRGGNVGSGAQTARRLGNSFAWFVVIAALSWPVLEPFGLCDHWPAWAVYAAKPERVTVFMHVDELSKLPEILRRYLGPHAVLDEWHPIRIDRWSLDSVYVPIYPQDRFQVGVALGLARDCDLQRMRIVIEGPANRWTGKRLVSEYVGLESIERLADSYRCGARPR